MSIDISSQEEIEESCTPRGWQRDCQEHLENYDDNKFLLLEATMGSGKTFMAAFWMAYLKVFGIIDMVVIVVPSSTVKRSTMTTWNKVGIKLKSDFPKSNTIPKAYDGVVMTYKMFANKKNVIIGWCRSRKVLIVFDEIHHLRADDEGNIDNESSSVWGPAAEEVYAHCERCLGMTGTLFRGDGNKISFVNYAESEISIRDRKYKKDWAIPDWVYDYRQAVADKVCRPVSFDERDSRVKFIPGTGCVERDVLLSECVENDVTNASRVVFRDDMSFLPEIILAALGQLNESCKSDPRAACLVVCQPGFGDDDLHVRRVARMIWDKTGENPVVITSHDGDESDAKIKKFQGKESTDRWIVAVRKISEGVDIPRLRVLACALHIGSELLFRQIVGRILRQVGDDIEESVAVIPAFPKMKEFAKRLSEEALAGLKKKRKKVKGGDGPSPAVEGFVPLSSTGAEEHEMVDRHGNSYTHDEYRIARYFKSITAWARNMEIPDICEYIKSEGLDIKIPESDQSSDDDMTDEEVKFYLCNHKEDKDHPGIFGINKCVTKIAYKLTDGPSWEMIPSVQEDLRYKSQDELRIRFSSLDDLRDNHSVADVRRVHGMANEWLKEIQHA